MGKTISFSELNYSQVQISKKIKINQSIVFRILSKYRMTGNTDNEGGKETSGSIILPKLTKLRKLVLKSKTIFKNGTY